MECISWKTDICNKWKTAQYVHDLQLYTGNLSETSKGKLMTNELEYRYVSRQDIDIVEMHYCAINFNNN